MDLTTRCPQCGTTFSASLEQLQLRKGYIRCINCAHIFDGFEAVVPASPSHSPGPGSGPTATPSPGPTTSPRTTLSGAPSPDADQTAASSVSPLPRAPARQPVPRPAESEPPRGVAARTPAQPSTQPVARPPVEPPAKPIVKAPAEPIIEAPAEPVIVMPSVVRQRTSRRSSPVHTVTVPPPSPSERSRPAFTISDDAPRGGPHDRGPVFSVGDAAHIRQEPAFGDVAAGSGMPHHDIQEPHIPIIPRTRNAAARVRGAEPSNEPAPVRGPASPASPASAYQRPAGSIYVEPRRGAEASSSAGETDFIGPERPAYYGIVRVFWAVLMAVGLILLLAQLLYVYRAQIANTVPVLRPVFEQACEPLHCKVPYTRRIDLISIMSSSLRAVAPADKGKDAASDSMMLQLTMRNQHDKPQEWPTLVLDLTDFSGTLVVRKNLPPQLYLPSEALQHPFAPASEMTVSVPIAMNGQNINGYQLAKFFQ